MSVIERELVWRPAPREANELAEADAPEIGRAHV